MFGMFKKPKFSIGDTVYYNFIRRYDHHGETLRSVCVKSARVIIIKNYRGKYYYNFDGDSRGVYEVEDDLFKSQNAAMKDGLKQLKQIEEGE